jgi:hypothetical protein
MNSIPPGDLIRISKEEATGSHVDDLLKRQMSLRGEPGVTRDRGKAWYYQTWFVLMIVGTLGAVSAWALTEPFFDDLLYFQGTITALNLDGDNMIPEEDQALSSHGGRSAVGQMTIRGEHIYVLSRTRELFSDGSRHHLDLDSLRVGEKVGAYLEFIDNKQGDRLPVATYVQRGSKLKPAKEGATTLQQLLSRKRISGLLLFPLVAGLIGLFVGAVDGIICRLPRRSLLCGGVGLLVGLLGGFVCDIAAEVAYAPLTHLAVKQSADSSSGLSTLGFVIQVFGRSLAWGMVGVAMGLGQGIALRSKRLLIYGLLGGVVGGLLGGMLFDPIDMIVLGPDKVSSHWSRLIGLAVIGASVGAMMGIVELLARDTWLRMTQGPLTGKEFILFKDVMNIGASPRSDIYLFNDPQVANEHAIIRTVGDECEIEARQSTHPVLLNNNSTRRARLRHGDTVGIGRTIFVFQRRRG